MAFERKIWTDRVAEFINRRILTKEDGSTEIVTVARSEGTISQEGDGFTANNMNDLEQRIANAFSERDNALIGAPDYSNLIATLTQNTTYTATKKSWLIGNFGAAGATQKLYINDVDIIRAYSGSGNVRDNSAVCLPLEVGDAVLCDSTYVYLNVYGMR